MTPPPADPELVEFAVALARDAGRLTLDWFQRHDLEIEHKGDGSPVTAADLAAETLIRERLANTFPADGVLGEEQGETGGSSDRTWVIDPIDGTKAFIRGVPLYSTLLSMVDQHGPAIGVIHLPALDETVWAGRGLGCLHDGVPCRVSDTAAIDLATITTSGLGYWPDDMLSRVLESPMALRTWGDAYGYALVATGRAEAMIDPLAFPWDVAPMAVILTEAGGRFTDLDGSDNPGTWRSGSGVATNGILHESVLAVLKSSTDDG